MRHTPSRRFLAILIFILIVATVSSWLFLFRLGLIDRTEILMAVSGIAVFVVTLVLFKRLIEPSDSSRFKSYLEALTTTDDRWAERYYRYLEGKPDLDAARKAGEERAEPYFMDLKAKRDAEREKYEKDYYVQSESAGSKVELREMVAQAWQGPGKYGPGNVRLLIYGEAKCGKSTALARLRTHFRVTAQATLKQIAPDKELKIPVLGGNTVKIPILVRLESVPIEDELPPLSLTEDETVRDYLGLRLERYLVDGKLILLFDCPNGDPKTDHIVDQLKQVAELAKKNPNNGYILVCLKENYDSIREDPTFGDFFGNFERWIIIRFTPEEVENHFVKVLGTIEGAEVYDASREGGLVDAACNPAVLGDLLCNYGAIKAVKGKAEALDALKNEGRFLRTFVDTSLENVEQTKKQKPNIERTLADLANILVTNSVPYMDVKSLLNNLPRQTLAEAYLRTPILRSFDPKEEKVGFTSRPLQDYYFARYLEQAIRDGKSIDEYISSPQKWWRYFVVASSSSDKPSQIVTAILDSNVREGVLLAMVCAIAGGDVDHDEKIQNKSLELSSDETALLNYGDALNEMYKLLRQQSKVGVTLERFVYPLLAKESREKQTAAVNFLYSLPREAYSVLWEAISNRALRPDDRRGIALALYKAKERGKADLSGESRLEESNSWHVLIQYGETYPAVRELSRIAKLKENAEKRWDAIDLLERVAKQGFEEAVRDELIEILLDQTDNREVRVKVADVLASVCDRIANHPATRNKVVEPVRAVLVGQSDDLQVRSAMAKLLDRLSPPDEAKQGLSQVEDRGRA